MQKDIYSNILKIYKDKLYKRNIKLNTYEIYKKIIKISLEEYPNMNLNDTLIFDIHLKNTVMSDDNLTTAFLEYKRYCNKSTSSGDIKIYNDSVLISSKILYSLLSKEFTNIFISKKEDLVIYKLILNKKNIENIIKSLSSVDNKKKTYV